MKIEINVDELQFKEILDGELKNLSKEKIHEVILEGIRTYFTTNPDVVEGLFVEKCGWGYQKQPTSYLRQIINTRIPYNCFEELVDGLINDLKKNHEQLLKEAMIELMINGMFNSYGFQDKFRETLMKVSNNN